MAPTTLDLIFFAGFVMQSVVLVGGLRRKELINFGICLGFSLAGVIWYGITDDNSNLLLVACLAYVITFAPIFRYYLLRNIGPELLIFWNILFVYTIYPGHPLLLTAAIFLLGLNVLSYLTQFIDRSRLSRTGFYVMYLLLVSGVVYYGASSVQTTLNDVVNDGSLHVYSPVVAFIAGMAVTSVAVNLAYVFELLPSQGRSLDEVKLSAKDFAAHYNPDRQKPLVMISAIALIAMILIVNSSLHIIGKGLLLSLAVVSSHMFTQKISC